MAHITRRRFLQATGSAVAVGALGFPAIVGAAGKKVVVVGGGAGGATAAKYIRMADPSIEVTLIEANAEHFTCFFSNEVLSGHRGMDSIKVSYDGLKGHGINVVIDTVTEIDAAGRKVKTAGGSTFAYDRCIVAPGIDFKDNIEGYDEAAMRAMPHAWKAGEQTVLLRKQLEAMPDGGVVAIVAPPNPFRCPPGPYERACQIAMYLRARKPKSKLMIFDAKDKFSKQGLFMQAFERHHAGIVEWVAAGKGGLVTRVDPSSNTIYAGNTAHKVDVANVIPAQKAGKIAVKAGLTDDKGWCPIDGRTFESAIHKNIHVVGDASAASPLPKSAYAANSEAKVAAAAVVDLLNGRQPGEPSLVNTCYSIIGPNDAISVAKVYHLDGGKLSGVEGSGGLTPKDSSPEMRAREVAYANSWFANIKDDCWG
ncbi:MAG: FAD-dependent oxidoreductase [Gammaproteobacteria bacterium]|nr:FAD-dependent oxidoreductase [Gammaproteobacteria bacterium]MCP5318156.1 FAD-dependent oxidoreductase [Chromatiaceae bacterium]MCW5587126.1 FAD-dependent oxidoreductase [Chromatiales bacterium]MCP5319202.1 FAD-dependent oxidoreductase [Chromatiaceae bacterium]HPE81461.1 NAD(P)/FAD-dependent oxidoreductase [Gammaproteobacteria bacterium]